MDPEHDRQPVPGTGTGTGRGPVHGQVEAVFAHLEQRQPWRRGTLAGLGALRADRAGGGGVADPFPGRCGGGRMPATLTAGIGGEGNAAEHVDPVLVAAAQDALRDPDLGRGRICRGHGGQQGEVQQAAAQQGDGRLADHVRLPGSGGPGGGPGGVQAREGRPPGLPQWLDKFVRLIYPYVNVAARAVRLQGRNPARRHRPDRGSPPAAGRHATASSPARPPSIPRTPTHAR